MSIPYLQLFLDKFINYNQNRYQNQPDFVTKLGKLTLNEITFANYAEETDNGQTLRVIDMSVPHLFIADRQKWRPAPFINTKVTNLADTTAYSATDLTNKSRAGIYLLDDNGQIKGVVLVAKGNKTEQGVKDVITLNCLYDIEDDDIAVDTSLSLATIDALTIVGELVVIESVHASSTFLYDGTYKYDGTMTY